MDRLDSLFASLSSLNESDERLRAAFRQSQEGTESDFRKYFLELRRLGRDPRSLATKLGQQFSDALAGLNRKATVHNQVRYNIDRDEGRPDLPQSAFYRRGGRNLSNTDLIVTWAPPQPIQPNAGNYSAATWNRSPDRNEGGGIAVSFRRINDPQYLSSPMPIEHVSYWYPPGWAARMHTEQEAKVLNTVMHQVLPGQPARAIDFPYHHAPQPRPGEPERMTAAELERRVPETPAQPAQAPAQTPPSP